jgi:hypothetical protein
MKASAMIARAGRLARGLFVVVAFVWLNATPSSAQSGGYCSHPLPGGGGQWAEGTCVFYPFANAYYQCSCFEDPENPGYWSCNWYPASEECM